MLISEMDEENIKMPNECNADETVNTDAEVENENVGTSSKYPLAVQ